MAARLAERSIVEKNIHSERLLPIIDEVIREAMITLNDVDAVAVSIGPGSFTGLRIGLSTAKGLATALRKPIIAVPTLDALAYEGFRAGAAGSSGIVCALIDAKRDEVFFSFYEIFVAGIKRCTEYAIAPVAEVHDGAARFGSVLFFGDGARKMEKLPAARKHRFNPEIVCSPAAVGILAEQEGRRLTADEASTFEPMYLRDFVTTVPGRKNEHAAQPLTAARQSTVQSFKG